MKHFKTHAYSIAAALAAAPCIAYAAITPQPMPACVRSSPAPTDRRPAEWIGFVWCFNPPTEAYSLTRAGQKVPLGWGVTVQGGDVLELNAAAGKGNLPLLLVVRLGKSELAIDEVHPKLQIPLPPTPPSGIQKAFAHLGAFLSGFVPRPDSESERPSVGFRIQGPGRAGSPIAIPLLGFRPGRLVAASRTAHLAWTGGVPPYSFRVYHKGADEPLIAISGLLAPRVAFDESKLPPGSYHVVVEDAKDVLSGGPLRILAPEELPKLEAGDADLLGRADAPQDLKATLFASWLARQQDGAWALEAYQHLTSISENFAPGVLLRQQLESGL